MLDSIKLEINSKIGCYSFINSPTGLQKIKIEILNESQKKFVSKIVRNLLTNE